ncbi:MAG: ABC transporter ATP-binding protein [Anaerolineae bacterium]|nr:ABC transporter ATP-binding protein [Anaerolineae bacterium]
MTTHEIPTADFKARLSTNRLVGLTRLLGGFGWHYAGATISLAVGAVAKTATYLLVQHFIDNVLSQPDFGRVLPVMALAFIGLALIEGTFTALSGRLAALTAEGVTLRLRNYLYDHIQRLTFTYHDQTRTGELIQRVTSDVDAVRRFFSEQLIGLGRIVLLFTVNFAALSVLNLKLALISIICVPVVGVVSMYFFRRLEKAYERFQEQEAVVSSTLQENLTGVRVVKAFARQSYEREKFDKENFEQFQRGRRLLMMHAFYWPTTDIIVGAQTMAGYLIAGLMVINGEITVGTFLAYVGLLAWMINPIRNLGRLITQLSTGMVSYERVAAVIREDREPITEGMHATGQARGEIVFDDLSFEYDSTAPVLHNISFRVAPGESIALLGSTGSGKTSLVNLLPRFYEYTSGKLMLDGVDIKALSREYLRQQIGIVEQEPFLFSRTIRENITYGVAREVSDEEVIAAAEAAAIHESIASFPEGYNTLVGEHGVTFSGGQKQRVAIARVLLKNPRILILDDATSSVDMETEADIRRALERLMEDRTTFIIAHRVQSLMNADQILVLKDGRIVQHGKHTDLVDQPGIYRQIYDVQARIEDELEKELAGV